MHDHELKFGIMGLENSGKSTLLYALQHISSCEGLIQLLEPTIQIKHSVQNFLDLTVRYWDFGGQYVYRKKYLETPKYFEKMDILLFLIDIQDENRFKESVAYLDRILEILKPLSSSESLSLNICFSKMDFTFNQDEFNRYEYCAESLTDLITTRYPEYKFEFFTTSVYDIYSIVRMFSMILHSYSSIANQIDGIIDRFGLNLNCKHIFIFNPSGMIVSQFNHTKDKYLRRFSSLTEILNNYLPIIKNVEQKNFNFQRTKDFYEHFIGYMYQFQIVEGQENKFAKISNYYLSIFADLEENDLLESSVENQIKALQNLINYNRTSQEKTLNAYILFR